MQLVAYGAQDVYLTGNPQITFWKVTYRRHTNFSMESIEQTFNGQADFGRRVTCTISRNGDLAYRTYLQVTLPEINQAMKNSGSDNAGVWARWLDFPGEQMISQVEVEIGGQRIDRQYGDWMHLWNQLTLSKEQERGYYKMIGNTSQLTFITDPSFSAVDGPCASSAPVQVCEPRNALPETTLYVPFQFWYCRNPGLALPLIALQYHEVKINLDIRPIDECLWAVGELSCSDAVSKRVTSAYNQSLVAASLYVDYVFLDTDERRRMAQNPTNTSSNSFSSLVMNPSVRPPTRSSSTLTTPARSWSLLSSLMPMLTTARPLPAEPPSTARSVPSPLTTLTALMPSLTPSWRSVLRTKPLPETSCLALVSSTTLEPSMSPPTATGDLPSPKVEETPLPPPVCPMPAPLSCPNAPSTCTAGVRIPLSPLSSNLTAKTDSPSAKVPTSTSSSLTNTTPVTPTLVLTSTPLPSDRKSTSHRALAISRALITPLSNWSCLTRPSRVPAPPRFACMPPTTTCSA